MRKKFFHLAITFLLIAFATTLGSAAALTAVEQEEEELPIREDVKVVNVEVPVRVFYKGKPVDNLVRSDFKLYEDKKLQPINNFEVRRYKIDIQEVDLQVKEKAFPPRYFVLVFRITEFSPKIKEGINHIFKNVLRKQDRLRVFINNKDLYFDKLNDMAGCQARVEQLLSEQSIAVRQRMQTYFMQLEQQVNKTKWRVLAVQIGRDFSAGSGGANDQTPMFIKQFLEKYLAIWKEFKRRYLVPDLDSYYLFAKHLQGIKMEKWVINFYQMEMFPQIAMTGEARRMIRRFISELRTSSVAEDLAMCRILDRLMNDIDKELNVANEFPTEEISKIFYKVDAGFHTVFMRSTLSINSQDYAYKQVASDIENSLREITKVTGGTTTASNDLVKAMEKISSKENVYYLLTYAPENPDKIGKIKVEVDKRKHKVMYDDNIRADFFQRYEKQKAPLVASGNSNIEVTELSFSQDKKLTISVNGFRLRKLNKRVQGQMDIRIRIKNFQGIAVFDQTKTLDIKKDSLSITIPFNNLGRGRYNVVVDVKDRITGSTATKFIQARIR